MYVGNQKAVIDYFKTATEFFLAGEYEWKLSGFFTGAQIERINKVKDLDAINIIKDCQKNDVDIITYNSEFYPKELLKIEDLPILLYSKGRKEILSNENKFAIVGSRHPSNDYLKATSEFARVLAENSMTIVSGGAMGIDSAAHEEAIKNNADTVCVLGSGLCFPYRTSFISLAKKIENTGVLISEFPPKTPAYKYNFPIRNRIISGISSGILITQAGYKSGSLITARYALEQGKDVFVTPGPIFHNGFMGSNKLIKDGAIPVLTPNDILYEYNIIDYNSNENFEIASKPKQKKSLDGDFDRESIIVYENITGEEISFDDLLQVTNLTADKLMIILTKLEMAEYIQVTQTGKYVYA